MKFYRDALPDPQSVPNERELDTNHHMWADYQLVFRADPTSEPGTIRAKWHPNAFDIEAQGDAVTAYLPATRALIDPVSPTRGNLIAQQVIRLPVWQATVTINNVETGGNEESGFITTLELDLPRDFPTEQSLVGLFSSWLPSDSDEDPTIIQVVGQKTSALDLSGQHIFFEEGKQYSLTIGPTRLAIPRDPNHGLIPIQFGELSIEVNNSERLPTVRFDVGKLRATEVSSVMALFPWGEWGPLPPTWLSTGRVRLHHRNLVQEHSEFESSFEDRFPPQGPPPTESGQPQSPLLPFADFVRAVRDRYTEASGNLEAGGTKATVLRNWLPGADLSAAGVKSPLSSRLRFEETKESVFPKVSLSWLDADGEGGDPDDVLGTQTLQIRKPGDQEDRNWLEFDAAPQALELETRPDIELRKVAQTARPYTRRLVNSSAPLLFDRHDITALSVVSISPSERYALLGVTRSFLQDERRPETVLGHFIEDREEQWTWESVGESDSQAVAAALCKVNERVVGVLSRADGTGTVFEVDAEGKVTEVDHPKIPGSPNSRAIIDVATAEHGADPVIAVAVRSGDATQLLVFRREDAGWKRDKLTLPEDEKTLTAVAIESCFGIGVRTIEVAAGFSTGKAALWRSSADDWPKPQTTMNSGKRHIEDVAIDVQQGGNSSTYVAAADGSSEVKLWTINDEAADEESIEHPAPVFSVCLAHAVDLDERKDQADLPAAVLLVTGCDDGRIRSWKIGNGVSLVRSASTSAAVRHVAADRLPYRGRGEEQEKNPVTLAAASADGRSWLWEGRSMKELAAPPALNPDHVLDNVGVLRVLPPRKRSEVESSVTWTVEQLHVAVPSEPGADASPTPELWQSFTVDQARLAVTELPESAPEVTGLTDIRFACESLKVRKDGTLPQYRFHDAPCYLGQYGFYSEITAPSESNLELLDHWPRLHGMPIHVTRLLTLKRESNGEIQLRFAAVLVNPNELAMGVDLDTERFDTAGLVRRALSRNSLVVIRLTRKPEGESTITIDKDGSSVDWLFGVGAQRQRRDPERGFSARLAQIVCPMVEATERQVVLHPDAERSRGLALGRLWPLLDLPPKLVGVGHFRVTNGRAEQLDFSYREGGIVDTPVEEPLIESAEPLPTLASLAWNRALAQTHTPGGDDLDPLAGHVLIVSNNRAQLLHRATGQIEQTIDVLLNPEKNERHPLVDAADWISLRSKSGEGRWLTRVVSGVRVMTDDGQIATIKPGAPAADPLREVARYGWRLDGEHLEANSRVLVSCANKHPGDLIPNEAGEITWAATVTEGSSRGVWFGPSGTDEAKMAGRLKSFSPALAMAWSDTSLVAVTSDGPEVKVWALTEDADENADAIAKFGVPGDDTAIVSLSAINDRAGRLIVATGNERGLVRVWVGLDASDPLPGLDMPLFEGAVEVSLAYDDERLVVAVGCKADVASPGALIVELDNEGHPNVARKFNVPRAISKIAAQATPMGLRLLVSSEDRVSMWAEDRVLRVSSKPEAAPEFSLGIKLSTGERGEDPGSIGDRYSIRARMARSRQLEVFLGNAISGEEDRALARLEQGPYSCFVIGSTSASGDRGAGVLVLWSEGDRVGSSTTSSEALAPPRRLGAAAIWQDLKPDGPASIVVPPNRKVALEGPLMALNVLASQVGLTSAPRWLLHRSESRILVSRHGDSELTLLLEGASTLLRQDAGANAGSAGYTMSGTLIWSDKDSGSVELQAPVRLANEGPIETPALRLISDAGWLERVNANAVGGASRGVDIIHPGDGSGVYTKEAVASQQAAPFEGFVRLTLTKSGEGLTARLMKLGAEDVPLNRDLEAGAVRRVPRQKADALQLLHRRGTGTRLRYDLDSRQFEPVVRKGKRSRAVKLSVGGEELHVRLLPAVNDGQRVVLLEESAWLSLSETGHGDQGLTTESLMVLFRPRSVGAAGDEDETLPEFVTVLENRTLSESEEPPGQAESASAQGERHYEELIRRAGAAGVAIVRRMNVKGDAEFRFINSPFFARDGEDTREDELEIALATGAPAMVPPGLAMTAFAAAPGLAEVLPPVPDGLDLRILRPKDVLRWSTTHEPVGTPSFHWYRAEDRSDDPLRNRPCVPHREFRWRRQLVVDESDRVRQTDFGKSIPSIRCLEATAFREMGRLSHIPGAGRRLGGDEQQKLFLPGTIDTRLAADKPGAAFHHLLQVQTFYPPDARTGPNGERPPWNLEPTVDVVVREAQQVKLTGCVTARVELKGSDIKKLATNDRLAELRVTWDEIIGTTRVDENLARPEADGLPDPTPNWLQISGSNDLELVRPPVQLVVQFNDEVLSVLPNEPAVPAYEVVSSSPDGAKTKFRHPARMFAITDLKSPAMGAHRWIVDAAGRLKVKSASGSWFRVSLRPDSDASTPGAGDAIDVFEVASAPNGPEDEPNRANWRVLPVPDAAGDFWLARDTMWGLDPVPEVPATWVNRSGEAKSALVEKRHHTSPIIVKLKATNGELPETGTAVSVGPDSTYLVMRVIGKDDGEYLLFRPAIVDLANTGNEFDGRWERVRTRVKPYVQASPGVVDVAPVAGSGASSITLSEADANRFAGLYLRIDQSDKLAAAVGDWKPLKFDGEADALHLLRPSYGNLWPLKEGPGGGRLYRKNSDNTWMEEGVDIVGATNSAPIVVETALPHEMRTGETAGISGVVGNTAANDDRWIIHRLDDHRVELYYDSRPGETDDETVKKDRISKIIPLDEAFGESQEFGDPARLIHEFDPYQHLGWKENTRPLLQVMWAGRVDTFDDSKSPVKGRFADLYDSAKQFKFLTPSQLSPKLAVVLVIKAVDGADKKFALHRTLLFGDAAPAVKGKARLTKGTDDQKDDFAIFEFVVADNHEKVKFGLPPETPSEGDIYLLKYLTTGVSIYDERLGKSIRGDQG